MSRGSSSFLPAPFPRRNKKKKKKKVRLEASGFLNTPSAHQICNPPTTIDGPFSLLRCRPLAMLGSLTTLSAFFREFSNVDQPPRRANRQQGELEALGSAFNLPSPYTSASYGYKWELTPSRRSRAARVVALQLPRSPRPPVNYGREISSPDASVGVIYLIAYFLQHAP